VKSGTDEHWDDRARGVANAAAVNIEDTHQRELELDFVCRHLRSDQRLLEVGCGNGFNTVRFRELVRSVDAFDFSGDMIARAKGDHPDRRVRYYEASVIDPAAASPASFDVVVCIRTLINLATLADQRQALANMLRWLRPGGLLLLVEGFADGFRTLSEVRRSLGMPAVEPAAINNYCDVADVEDLVEGGGEIVDRFHSGTWDLLTRVALPLVAGADRVNGVGPHHPALLQLALILGNDHTGRYARLHGWAVRTRATGT
jgi:ubiquinone/menaquinone biosynthesis C-methylase UbiE